MKNRLMTPGPVPVPEDALLAMARPVIHHRTEEFRQVMAEVKDGLKYVFQTVNDVLILMASSTGAMESAVVNLLSPGDEVLVIKGGKFGERWEEICEAYNVKVHPIDIEWGKAVNIDIIREKLNESPNIKCVYSTLCETSTGVHHDIKGLGEVVNKFDNTLLVVDAVSALGAVDLQMDNWHVDVVVSGSQKGLMTPPGLGFICLSDVAWKFTEKSQLPGYYFDLSKTRECIKKNETPFTTGVSVILALRESLKLIMGEGLENVLARHTRLAKAVRAGVKAIGLELYASIPSNVLTAVKVPDNIDGIKLLETSKNKYGVAFAGGQGKLKGKIIRIAHLGYCDDMDAVTAVSALEMALADLGYTFEMGAGVKSCQEVLQP